MLKLYNTLTRKLEDFVPLEEGKVRFYHCGPTVYWTQHIGNLRAMTMGDLLVRTLRYFAYEVKHVRNYTDVGHLTSDADTGEDKMEKGAQREGLSPQKIAGKYIKIFESDTAQLNLLEPTFKPRATGYLEEMIKLVEELLQKGFAYTTDMAVYFEVAKFPRYTELSKQKLDQLLKGAGKAQIHDPTKKGPLDFALWFFRAGSHAKAMQYWPSPFTSKLVTKGEGFPGWHLECSAMCRALLGKTIDIHMGGIEHIPVHHTNEIAQSEAANGVKFVNYWLHNEWLVVEEKKLAKSAGGGLTLEDIRKRGFEPLTLRYFYLTAHYRTRQNFTWPALKDAQNAYHELQKQVSSCQVVNLSKSRTSLSAEKLDKVDAYRKRFEIALANDFNIPQALAVVWEVVKSNLPSPDKYDLILNFDEVLGLGLGDLAPAASRLAPVPTAIGDLAAQREELRRQQKFFQADEIRQQIERQGYQVHDTPNGPQLSKK